jgi:hypothetical protein
MRVNHAFLATATNEKGIIHIRAEDLGPFSTDADRNHSFLEPK